MTEAPLGTLLHPFRSGLLDAPDSGMRALFLNAPGEPGLPADFTADIELVQDMRPAFLRLRAAGFGPRGAAAGEGFDVALVLCGRFRGGNERAVAEAVERVRQGGLIVIGGAKSDGAASLRKRVSSHVRLTGHAAKHHGVVLWMRRNEAAVDLAADLRDANRQLRLAGGFVTEPGMFSHDRVDGGSRLLAESLPADIAGTAADFGAGWGYLSVELARRAPAVAAIDLYEASRHAAELARRNMATLVPRMPAEIVWSDVLQESPLRSYDFVVMNPPFHEGARGAPSLGEAMIARAAKALRPRGRLFMVANAHLPYERALAANFSAHEELARDRGFKVFAARR